MSPTAAPDMPPALLLELEETALELARLAGTEIVNALGRSLTIRYKTFDDAEDSPLYRDPVSEVDQKAEHLIRERLAERFGHHGILGEELEDSPVGRDGLLWAIDPIDGTTNFVNGFPLFASSIGVLSHGRPVAGAVWCSTSHALRPGVYHAHAGGPLNFDGEKLLARPNPAVRRRLAGMPHAPMSRSQSWDSRKTGSAAIECAFVAAGLLQVAGFVRPNIWDVAAGLVLVSASGGSIYAKTQEEWARFDGFGTTPARSWRESLVIGDDESAGAYYRAF
ncbi:inositol monophosphatase family protein [Plastoroseomonas hellenica]|uniref:inositol monophosphatase family protein n=1 Tax=Plastoroseomonas hellenica TaxID=2687306 RepID=UPI001FE6A343|nr:inositol monophosphatase family protein [Plastoroseomonas hellenica]